MKSQWLRYRILTAARIKGLPEGSTSMGLREECHREDENILKTWIAMHRVKVSKFAVISQTRVTQGSVRNRRSHFQNLDFNSEDAKKMDSLVCAIQMALLKSDIRREKCASLIFQKTAQTFR